MKITKNSPISEFVNNQTIEQILGINNDFKELSDWTLKKYASSGVVVKDFAKIGNMCVNNFLKHIEDMGFDVEHEATNETSSSEKDIEFDENSLTIVTLDVRPTIASGSDPFQQIMQAISILKEDETLKIINVFVPIPLINVLKGRGFKSWTNSISSNEHHTFFTKSTGTVVEKKEENNKEEKGDFDAKLSSFGNNVKEIDVRLLEMPEPMVTILEELESLPQNHVLLVNHKKVPQFLLPELKSRNFKWMHKDIEEGYILFIVYK